METVNDINKHIVELLEKLHMRLDNIELLLTSNEDSQSNSNLNDKSPKKESPSNHGARWTKEQEKWMLNAIAKNTSIDKIAEMMERTSGGIRSRLLMIARIMVKQENKSYEEASKITSMSIEDIKRSIKLSKLKN